LRKGEDFPPRKLNALEENFPSFWKGRLGMRNYNINIDNVEIIIKNKAKTEYSITIYVIGIQQ